MADWSKLPVAVLWMIAVRLFSAVELKCFRSICRSWRSSVSGGYRPLSSRPLIKLSPLIVVAAFTTQEEVEEIQDAFISRASFYRVTHSSQSHGWLIKSDVDINLGTFQFINPLSRHPYHHRCQSLNLLKFTFTEIREAYDVQNSRRDKPSSAFERVIFVTLEGGDHFIGIGFDGKIRYWNGEIWTRIRIKNQMAQFCDIIVFRGSIYALDSKGIVWWISAFSAICRLEASLEKNTTRDMNFVECCGELYIVQRLHEENPQKRKAISMDHNACVGAIPPFYIVIHDDAGYEKTELSVRHCSKTIGFKVYKLNESLVKWVEVKSLGNNAFMMATDSCFSVVAHEFYGCLPNAIYFNDEKEEEIKVFQLDDGSIVTILAELFPSVYPSHL